MNNPLISSMTKASAPVVVFVYNRPDLAKALFRLLESVQPERLFIVADGSRDGDLPQTELIEETRAAFSVIPWECDVTRIYSDTNLGLRKRIITGLDVIFSMVDRAIILEDDCLPDESFFGFCTELLERYQTHNRVRAISGNNFSRIYKSGASYYFSSDLKIWGWATWKSTWIEFRQFIDQENQFDLRNTIKAKRSFFDKLLFQRMLRNSNNLDSWSLDFFAFFVSTESISVVPAVNLVTNRGLGSDSTHTKFESWADEVPLGSIKFPLRHPKIMAPNTIEMWIEGFAKDLYWVTYPIVHPVRALIRIRKFVRG